MGSAYVVKFVGDVPEARVRGVVAEVLDEFDRTFSKWREDSELLACNRAAATAQSFRATPRFSQVLELALQMARATDGAFDPTVEPLMRLYRAAKTAAESGEDAVLEPTAVAAARERIGHRHVSVDSGMVHFGRPGVELDLDGIVAGACLDELAARLRDLGVPGAFLDVTGEIYCYGEKAPGVPWLVAVVDPRADLTGRDAAFVSLPARDLAVCTSGDYRNAFLGADGRVVHHVFDPRTGTNSKSAVVSATVLAASAAVADALGTALLVLGEHRGQRVLDRVRGELQPAALMLVGDEAQGGLRAIYHDWPATGR